MSQMATDEEFKCCGTKYNGNILLTQFNICGAILHFFLAFGMVLVLTYWRVDGYDSSDLALAQVFLYTGLFLWAAAGSYMIASLGQEHQEYKVDPYKDQNKTKGISAMLKSDPRLEGSRRLTAFIVAGVGFACAFTGFWHGSSHISGTFPLLITLSPNTQEEIVEPYNNTVCNGTDYKDKSVFEWTQCIRDNPKFRNIGIYDMKTGEKKPWTDHIHNKPCDDPLVTCNDIIHVLSSNEACVKCGGGENCGRRRCQIADNPGSFQQVGNNDNDPSSFVPIGTAEVIIPYNDFVSKINISSIGNTSALVEGDVFKFYWDGQSKGPKTSGVIKDDKFQYQRNLYVWWLLFAFSFITFAMHAVLAASGINEMTVPASTTPWNCCNFEWGYLYELGLGRQPYRWWEYSITASLMFIIVLQLNRVTDLWINITAFLLSAGYNSFGAALDLTDEWFFIYWFFAISSAMFVGQFACLYYNQQYTIAPYLDDTLPTHKLWGQLFAFVSYVNVGIFVTYLTFPINNLIHMAYRNDSCCGKVRCDGTFGCRDTDQNHKRNCTWRAEIGYICLSFTSKALLVFFVFWGVGSRND